MQIFVHLSQIVDNRFQRRTEYGDIAELAADIHRHKAARPGSLGLLQLPAGRVIFRNASEPDGRLLLAEQVIKMLTAGHRLMEDSALTVELQFGHRRKRAIELLATTDPDYAFMPIIIGSITDDQMLDGVWSENRARRDLSAVEEAELLQLKLKQLSASQREVADAWGLSRPTVANRLRLLELPPEVQQANRDGRLSERQCLALLPVVELINLAPSGTAWGKGVNSWDAPMPPAKLIQAAVADPAKLTSDDIREYHKRALAHAGSPLPVALAKFDCPPDEGIIQANCTGCQYRTNNTCLHQPCLTAKKQAYGRMMAMEAAAELGIPFSGRLDDFKPYCGNYNNGMKDLVTIHRAGGCEHLVVGWHEDGWGARPFNDNSNDTGYGHVGDNAYDGRGGVCLGHRGGHVPCLPGNQNAQDQKNVPTSELIEAWQKAAKKQEKRIDTAVTQAITAHLRRSLTDPMALAGVMSLGSWPQWKEGDKKNDPDTIIKRLVGHMHSRGKMSYSSYGAMALYAHAATILQEAGLDPALLDVAIADDPRGVVMARAVRCLLFWQEHLNHYNANWIGDVQPEIATCRREFDRVGVMGDGAAELSMWLDIAAQDIEERLTAKEKRET